MTSSWGTFGTFSRVRLRARTLSRHTWQTCQTCPKSPLSQFERDKRMTALDATDQ
jgi:hypothetical protein